MPRFFKKFNVVSDSPKNKKEEIEIIVSVYFVFVRIENESISSFREKKN